MSDFKKIYDRSMASYQSALLQQQSEFQAAVATGDLDAQVIATQNLANIEEGMRNYNAMAQRYAESQKPRQAPPMPGEDQLSRGDLALCRKYGIAPDDLPAAKNWTTNSNFTDEQKVQTYVENQKRYRQARADGSYRDARDERSNVRG